MPEHILVANRGEIAIRVLRTAADLEIESTAVHALDDSLSLHTRHADHVIDLKEEGVAAYLNIDNVIRAALENGCDAIHPGYGFLSESAEFARACESKGISFIGPQATVLELFGNKAAARALAESCGVPVLPGTSQSTSLEEANTFFSQVPKDGSVMLKAIAGGGGRGIAFNVN